MYSPTGRHHRAGRTCRRRCRGQNSDNQSRSRPQRHSNRRPAGRFRSPLPPAPSARRRQSRRRTEYCGKSAAMCASAPAAAPRRCSADRDPPPRRACDRSPSLSPPQEVGDEEDDGGAQRAVDESGEQRVLLAKDVRVKAPAPREHRCGADDQQRPQTTLEAYLDDAWQTITNLRRTRRLKEGRQCA